MTYTDFLVIKFIVICVGAFFWGIYTKLNGLDLQGRPERPGQQDQDEG